MSEGAATAELLAAAKDAAARNTDYYALLALSPDDPLTRDSVQSAWRKRSLKYHPDKAGAAFDAAKWEEFGLARDVLASAEARAAYDAARSALLQKQRERDLMNSKQRRFAEDLERAEMAAARAAASAAGGTNVSRRRQGEEGEGEGEREAQSAEEQREKERQAAEGRRYMEERKRKLREAEQREKERERKEDEERDDRIRELEDQIAEKARRRAEKKAKREARKSGSGGVAAADEEDNSTKTKISLSTSAAAPPPPLEATKPAIPTTTTAPEIKISDDPIEFWETQWPKTKARLLAAQATKERRKLEATRATATT